MTNPIPVGSEGLRNRVAALLQAHDSPLERSNETASVPLVSSFEVHGGLALALGG